MRTNATIASWLLLGACQPADVPQAPGSPVGVDQVAVSTRAIDTVEADGLRFRDLNRNGSLDPYEDWRLSPGERADDLLGRMTLEEKAGQLAHGNIQSDSPFGVPAKAYDMSPVAAAVLNDHVTTFIVFASLNFLGYVEQNNAVQEIAERGRLGIPATISSDPRHHFLTLFGGRLPEEGFSRWPEPTGFAALDDEELTFRFASIAAREYRATGFSQALSPQADLSTEPRWGRIHHTFGEDADVAARMVGAYIRGFQGGSDGVQPGHVSTVVKHWVGYGAARNGFDSHNYYGRFADLAEEDLPNHLTPFNAAFDVHVSGVMPAYSIFDGLAIEGQAVEPVGAAFSEVLIDDLLRTQHDFNGLVLSDWSIVFDCSDACLNGLSPGQSPDLDEDISTAWGVLDLTVPERFALAMKAGVDQFGSVIDPGPILAAVEQGLLAERRIDQSVRRILILKFATGLFESPFVDAETAKSIVNSPQTQALALETQSRSMVLLKAPVDEPLLGKPKQALFLVNAEADVFEQAGHDVVSDIGDADVAIVRLSAPYETLHPNYLFGALQHEGSLAFDPDGEEMTMLRDLQQSGARVIVDVFLDRPAVLTNVVELADVLIGNFGASDLALLRALDGTVPPEGRLPFELASSMDAVERQDSGKPADSEDPLFPLHYSASQ